MKRVNVPIRDVYCIESFILKHEGIEYNIDVKDSFISNCSKYTIWTNTDFGPFISNQDVSHEFIKVVPKRKLYDAIVRNYKYSLEAAIKQVSEKSKL